MLREFIISCGMLVWAVIKRFYIWIFVVLNPLDLWNKFKPNGYPSIELTRLGSWVVSSVIIIIVVFLAYHELRMKYVPRRGRNDPPDILSAKKELADFVVDHLAPCSGVLYEANRVSTYVFIPQGTSQNIAQLVKLGIMARYDGRNSAGDLLDKEKMRQWQLDAIEDHLVSAISRYLAQASVLDLVCGEIIKSGKYEDRRNYPQKGNRDLYSLIFDWWSRHSKLKISLNRLVEGSNFPKIKYAIRERGLLKANFNEKNIDQFIEIHSALI